MYLDFSPLKAELNKNTPLENKKGVACCPIKKEKIWFVNYVYLYLFSQGLHRELLILFLSQKD